MRLKAMPAYHIQQDRVAIGVTPLKSFIDWQNALSPGVPIMEIPDGTVYVINSRTPEKMKQWLGKNFDKIFCNELMDWHTDPKDWPQNRTYEMFTQWFRIEIYSMLVSLEK